MTINQFKNLKLGDIVQPCNSTIVHGPVNGINRKEGLIRISPYSEWFSYKSAKIGKQKTSTLGVGLYED